MNQQEPELVFKRYPGRVGIAGSPLGGDHHVTENLRLNATAFALLHGKRDHIGRPIPLQVIPVDHLNAGIIDNQNRQLGIRKSRDV